MRRMGKKIGKKGNKRKDWEERGRGKRVSIVLRFLLL